MQGVIRQTAVALPSTSSGVRTGSAHAHSMIDRAGKRQGICAVAFAATLASALLVPVASAAAKAYTPPAKKKFFGVSDTGEVRHFKKFRKQVKAHPAVLQTFHTWGVHPWRAMDRWAQTNTRGMLSVGTSECYACEGVISPKRVAKGYGDEYPLLLNRRFAAEKETVYIRLFPEMNGHWNDYAAFSEGGAHRGPTHKTKWFRLAWRRFAIIVRGGSRNKVNRRLERQGLPPLLRTESEERYREHRVGRRLPRARIALLWVPQSQGSPNIRGNQPGDYWPGGKWVDWVGVDIYAKFPNFDGMKRIYRTYRGKPFVIGEWSSWDHDAPKFTRRLFDFARKHKRVRMLAYYQGFESSDPHRVWQYPKAQRVIRNRLKRGFPPFAAGAKRPRPSKESEESQPPAGGIVAG